MRDPMRIYRLAARSEARSDAESFVWIEVR